MIRQTSLFAHQDIQEDGTAESQRMTILRFIRNNPGMTRNEISYNSGIRINAVCGRVNELIKTLSIYEDGKKIDKLTNKQGYILKANRVKEETE